VLRSGFRAIDVSSNSPRLLAVCHTRILHACLSVTVCSLPFPVPDTLQVRSTCTEPQPLRCLHKTPAALAGAFSLHKSLQPLRSSVTAWPISRSLACRCLACTLPRSSHATGAAQHLLPGLAGLQQHTDRGRGDSSTLFEAGTPIAGPGYAMGPASAAAQQWVSVPDGGAAPLEHQAPHQQAADARLDPLKSKAHRILMQLGSLVPQAQRYGAGGNAH